MPPNNETFLWTLFQNRTSVNIMKIIAAKIPMNLLSNGVTFLYSIMNGFYWSIKSPYHIEEECILYLIDLIEQIEGLPINFRPLTGQYEHITCISRYIKCDDVWRNVSTDVLRKFIKVLSNHDYNFIENRTSVLTVRLTYHTGKRDVFKYSILLSADSYDIYADYEWIEIIMKCPRQIHLNYIYYLLRHKNYLSFMYKSYTGRHFWGPEYCKFIMICLHVDNKKAIEMLEYQDKDGNTVLHEMAKRHDKAILCPVMAAIGNKLDIKPNKDEKMPTQLYLESKLR